MSARAELLTPLTPVHHDWALSFEQATPGEALAYWNECRGTRSMPLKTDISVRGMKRFIANVSLVDVHSNNDGTVDYYVRLTGERVRELYGPIAHRKLSEFLPADMEQRWRTALDLVRAARRPLRVHGRMSYADHTWLYQETLLAPLSSNGEETDMFLMATAWRPCVEER
jgi:hypothetical protein